MSLTFGFYDSVNGDRKYNSLQMASVFDGIITDGIFPTIYEQFMVSEGSGMTVNVAPGRAWLNHTWTLNDAILPVTIDESEAILNRIDTIVIRVDRLTRENKIEVVKGTPSTSPAPPICRNNVDIVQYPLCDIYVDAGVTKITQANITNRVGVEDGTPFVEGVLPNLDIEKFIAQWNDQWDEWFTTKTTKASDDFYAWFSELNVVLEGDVAANLANKINTLENYVDTPEMHRNIFRGKCLGRTITDAQKVAIQNGTFDDMYVGDYWEADITHNISDTGETIDLKNVKWRIVDFDYWLGTGDREFTQHHVVIMPDTEIANFSMNESNNTDGGYAGSRLRTILDTSLHALIYDTVFEMGAQLLFHKEYLVNAVTDGYPSGGAWCESSVELPNEIMMFGSYIFTPNSNGSIDVCRYTVSKTQLSLFRLCPKFISTRSAYWLRDVVNSKRFAFVSDYGEASYTNASNTRGVRPVFAIG